MISLPQEYLDNVWGSYTADSFLHTLQGSQLDGIDLLLRESIQNSYDARINNGKSVKYYCVGKNVVGSPKQAICSFFSQSESKGNTNMAKKLARVLQSKESLHCIEISDKNSVGLQGPYYQYDDYGNENKGPEFNYRDFILQLGAKKNEKAGGFFGVGKTCYYKASKENAVIVYSRTKYLGKLESRLIARFFILDGDQYEKVWVGAEFSNNPNNRYPRPFLDKEADDLASSFGMMKYEFDETGTSILILDSNLADEFGGDYSFDDVFRSEVPARIIHWFWPKVICPIEGKRITFSIELDGESISLPSLDDPKSPYSYFKLALKKLEGRSSKDTNLIPVERQRPKTNIGAIAFQKCYSPYLDPELLKRLIGDCNGKVCLAFMRDVEFVVKYETFSVDNDSNELIFGLFHTNPNQWIDQDQELSIDSAFKMAENTTHSDWIPSDITANQNAKSIVNVGLDKIKTIVEETFTNPVVAKGTIDVSGTLAARLGKLLPFGLGASPSPWSLLASSHTSSGKGAISKRDIDPTLVIINNVLENVDEQIRIVTCRYSYKRGDRRKIKLIPYVWIEGGITFDSGMIELVSVKEEYAIPGGVVSQIIDSAQSVIEIEQSRDYLIQLRVTGNLMFGCKLEKVSK